MSIGERLDKDWSIIASKILEHTYLALTALLIASLIAIPLGIVLTRYQKWASPIFAVISVIQTIPSLAMLGFMIPFLGIGTKPALVALVLYSLLPILLNTYTGIKEVNPSLIEAGAGMGMTRAQLIRMVQLPLAKGVIITGIRTATVQTISITTIATFIGAGGLGDLIMQGIQRMDNVRLLEGAIPVALLAVLFSLLLTGLNRLLTPKGLRKKNDSSNLHD